MLSRCIYEACDTGEAPKAGLEQAGVTNTQPSEEGRNEASVSPGWRGWGWVFFLSCYPGDPAPDMQRKMDGWPQLHIIYTSDHYVDAIMLQAFRQRAASVSFSSLDEKHGLAR